jgi:hypothetical protein
MPKYRLHVRITNEHHGTVTVEAKNVAAALETAQEQMDNLEETIEWEPEDLTRYDELELVSAETVE